MACTDSPQTVCRVVVGVRGKRETARCESLSASVACHCKRPRKRISNPVSTQRRSTRVACPILMICCCPHQAAVMAPQCDARPVSMGSAPPLRNLSVCSRFAFACFVRWHHESPTKHKIVRRRPARLHREVPPPHRRFHSKACAKPRSGVNVGPLNGPRFGSVQSTHRFIPRCAGTCTKSSHLIRPLSQPLDGHLGSRAFSV